MNKNKKLALALSSVTVVFLALKFAEDLGICSGSDYGCLTKADGAEYILFIAPLALFFSLITLFLRGTVFIAWWKFARWSIPTVLILSFIISLKLHHTPGGWFNLDKEVDLTLNFLMYLVFILGSAWQMYRGFKQK